MAAMARKGEPLQKFQRPSFLISEVQYFLIADNITTVTSSSSNIAPDPISDPPISPRTLLLHSKGLLSAPKISPRNDYGKHQSRMALLIENNSVVP